MACLGLLPAPALAYDWSLSTTETQTFETNDNQWMRNPSPGWSLGSYTTITANGVVLTPTSRLGCQAVIEDPNAEIVVVIPRYTINQVSEAAEE